MVILHSKVSIIVLRNYSLIKIHLRMEIILNQVQP